LGEKGKVNLFNIPNKYLCQIIAQTKKYIRMAFPENKSSSKKIISETIKEGRELCPN